MNQRGCRSSIITLQTVGPSVAWIIWDYGLSIPRWNIMDQLWTSNPAGNTFFWLCTAKDGQDGQPVSFWGFILLEKSQIEIPALVCIHPTFQCSYTQCCISGGLDFRSSVTKCHTLGETREITQHTLNLVLPTFILFGTTEEQREVPDVEISIVCRKLLLLAVESVMSRDMNREGYVPSKLPTTPFAFLLHVDREAC